MPCLLIYTSSAVFKCVLGQRLCVLWQPNAWIRLKTGLIFNPWGVVGHFTLIALSSDSLWDIFHSSYPDFRILYDMRYNCCLCQHVSMVLESGIPRNVRECQKCVFFLPGLGNFSWKLYKFPNPYTTSLVYAQFFFSDWKWPFNNHLVINWIFFDRKEGCNLTLSVIWYW